jgi:hypothetical protein
LGQSDETLPPERRIAYYRAMAAEALRLAQTASDEAQKASYVDMAARWNVLAAETERRMIRESRDNKSNSESESDGDRR